jgi:1-acyl-sn-glycerol-3-phosphate acyltransferase
VLSWPLFGLLCRRAQTIFIERNTRRNALEANKLIADRITQGECVALFPEGTTTDGLHVGHFHSSLLQCAVDAGCTVYPVAIHYHDNKGRHSSDAAFINDMTLLQSLKQVLFSHSLHATLVILPPMNGAEKNRRTLTTEAHAAIRTVLDDMALCASRQPQTALQQRLRRMAYGSSLADTLTHHRPDCLVSPQSV